MIYFIIPAYNEENNILSLCSHIAEHMERVQKPYKVVIINDGSTDGTLEKIISIQNQMPVEVHSHYPNQGVGVAFQNGFKIALELSKSAEDIGVTLEADNTSDLKIMDQMLKRIEEGHDVALASCYAKEGGVLGTKFHRKVLSKIANFLFYLILPIRNVRTYSSFYRAYRMSTLKKLKSIYGECLILEKGFECMVELLIKLAKLPGIKIVEVPMILHGQNRIGKSKMPVLATIKGFLKVILVHGFINRKLTATS
ncbi:MAG: glycosyltransferase family 2 protein [Deltaproteobacteria bacterium]|nr:glycosyltransferase family 2 protein [Deltaproteobacteria bacterium]